MDNNHPTPNFNDSIVNLSKSFKPILESFNSLDLFPLQETMSSLTSMISEVNRRQAEPLLETMKNISSSISEINSNHFKELSTFLQSSSSQELFKSVNNYYKSIYKLNSESLNSSRVLKDSELSDILNEIDNPQVAQVKNNESNELISELKNKFYNFSHNHIAPFKNKEKLKEWFYFFIIEQLLTSNDIPKSLQYSIIFIICMYLSSDN